MSSRYRETGLGSCKPDSPPQHLPLRAALLSAHHQSLHNSSHEVIKHFFNGFIKPTASPIDEREEKMLRCKKMLVLGVNSEVLEKLKTRMSIKL